MPENATRDCKPLLQMEDLQDIGALNEGCVDETTLDGDADGAGSAGPSCIILTEAEWTSNLKRNRQKREKTVSVNIWDKASSFEHEKYCFMCEFESLKKLKPSKKAKTLENVISVRKVMYEIYKTALETDNNQFICDGDLLESKITTLYEDYVARRLQSPCLKPWSKQSIIYHALYKSGGDTSMDPAFIPHRLRYSRIVDKLLREAEARSMSATEPVDPKYVEQVGNCVLKLGQITQIKKKK